VIIIPTVMGVQPLEIGFAERLVELGYHVVVADLFGRRFTLGVDREAAFAAMGQLRADRAALRDRLLAIVDEVGKREHVDKDRIAVIGYCFGGSARSMWRVLGRWRRQLRTVRPARLPPQPIKGRRLSWLG
jgi:dienelactone hydrolase